MLLEKIESGKWSAPFAKKKEDVKTSDLVTIVADIERGTNKFNPDKPQLAVRVRTRNGEKMVSLNQMSINILIEEFGTNDSAKWLGKVAKVLLHPTIIAGEKVLVLYLVGPDWELDEYGSPFNPKKVDTQKAPEEDIPTINVDEDKEIKIEDVPF